MTRPKSMSLFTKKSIWNISVIGRLVRNMPNAIGKSRSGSKPFTMARYIKTNEIAIITQFCHCIEARPELCHRSPIVFAKTSNILFSFPFTVVLL